MIAFRPKTFGALTVLLWFWCGSYAFAEGLLDGRVFTGMIGPSENPDLADTLYFNDGYFWSDICTRCGFLPGSYSAKETDEGIVFRGILESNSRGRFEYEGLARDDGTIGVSIQWERKRWYWTSSRKIVFQGTETRNEATLSLKEIRIKMDTVNPGANPLCARF